MKNNSFTDFILCITAVLVALGVAIMCAVGMLKESTALVFLSISIACIGVSLLNTEMLPKRNRSATPSKSNKRK